MFRENEAVHPEVYKDLVKNQTYSDGLTFGQMEEEINAKYREKVDAYGLKYYFTTDDDYLKDERKAETIRREAFKKRMQDQGRLPKPEKK